MISLNDSKVAHWKSTAAPVNTHLFLEANSEPIVFKMQVYDFSELCKYIIWKIALPRSPVTEFTTLI